MPDIIKADIDRICSVSTLFRTTTDDVGTIDTVQVATGVGDPDPRMAYRHRQPRRMIQTSATRSNISATALGSVIIRS